MSDRDDDEGLGGRFWLAIAGLCVGAVMVALIVLIIFGALWNRWGLFGALIAFFIVLLAIGWLWDRREKARRARLYAERWGFGALIVTNLFGWRATDPDEMKAARDPVGSGNDDAILSAAKTASLTVCAWGNHGAHLGRSTKVLELLRRRNSPSPSSPGG